jgi:hypothetical protein
VFIFVLALKRASPYVLIQSNQKSSQQKGFFAALSLCPANRAEPSPQLWGESFALLPTFARSCFADRKNQENPANQGSDNLNVLHNVISNTDNAKYVNISTLKRYNITTFFIKFAPYYQGVWKLTFTRGYSFCFNYVLLCSCITC